MLYEEVEGLYSRERDYRDDDSGDCYSRKDGEHSAPLTEAEDPGSQGTRIGHR